jgi:DNA-binding response OmpR family regulator
MNDAMAAATVLVVEDEWLIAEYLCDALEDSGYSVAGPASLVKQALTLVERNGFDIAILDVSQARNTAPL